MEQTAHGSIFNFWGDKPVLNKVITPLPPFNFWRELMLDTNVPFQTWFFNCEADDARGGSS